MELKVFLKIKKLGYLEKFFVENIFFKDYGEIGLDLLSPEVDFDREDGSGKKWRVDFILQTKKNKFAIECDGFNYHAPGMVDKDRFNELEAKETYLSQLGYRLIKLSKDQIVDDPQEAIYYFRRAINLDKELFNIFSKRNDTLINPSHVQRKALEALSTSRKENKKKGIVVLATGLGKTYLAAFDVKFEKAKTILFIAHVEYILKQARNSFEEVIPDRSTEMGFFTGRHKEIEGRHILFATIQTLTKKKNIELFDKSFFDYIIVDECHHSSAKSYQIIFDYFQTNFLLGLTATPERHDQADIYSNFDNNIIFEMYQEQAIKEGHLCKISYKGFLDNVDYSNIHYNGFRYDVSDLNNLLMIEERDKAIIKQFKKLADKKKSIGFCASIEHANWCAKSFRDYGYKSIAIHSKINYLTDEYFYYDSQEIISAFKDDKHQIVFVVDMLNEGIDIPDVECLIMLRPTESSTIFNQQIGRGLRVSEGKEEILILDFIGNYKTSPRIFSGLGINKQPNWGIHIDKEGKEIYYYDNDGKRVEFDSQVIDIIKFQQSRSDLKIHSEKLSQDWIDYGLEIERLTSEGSNLYWTIGKKNNNLDLQLRALDFIEKNKANYSSNKELSEAIQNNAQEVGKSLEGIRALFFSQILGLIKRTYPFTHSKAYLNLKKKNNEMSRAISDQFEKFYFYNSIFSLTNRHSSETRTVNQFFNIYPIFFIYQIFYVLIQQDNKPTLTKFELEHFVFFMGNNLSVNECVKLIIRYRKDLEKYELEKYLRSKSRMDSRLYKELRNIIYFSYSNDSITLKKDLQAELINKVEKFNTLLASNKLIKFTSENEIEYFEMLWSEKDLLQYHHMKDLI